MTNEQAKEIGKILDRIKRKKGFEYAPTVHELQELLQQEYIEMKANEYFAFGDMSSREAYIDGYKQALKDNNL